MTTKGFFLGVLVGGVVGAALGLLFAPLEGAATRQKIGEVSGSAKDKVSEIATGVAGKVQHATEAVRQAI